MKRIIGLVLALALLMAALPMPAQRAEASAKYYITVDITNQIVTVYENGNTSKSGIVRQMICSTGRSGTATPTGTYTLPTKRYSTERREWYYFPKYNCYAKWATRIVGGILFHSVLYTGSKRGPTSSSVNALGSKASHGCVRLRVPDAKWIAQNCPAGTKCRIFKSGKTDSALRRLLLKKSFYRGDESYAAFTGGEQADDGTLSRGSRGERVEKLQRRLKALGFLNDGADGIFGAKTEAGVKSFQQASGLSETGAVKETLWNAIFADDAPTGTHVPLSKGMSGPAVATLQKALIALRLFDGEADGSYSKATAKAVKRYQKYFGFDQDGKAGTALQKDALARAEALKDRFGDEEYKLVTGTEKVSMAKVKGIKKASLFSKAKKSSKKLAKVKNKTAVTVLSKSKSWTKVEYKGQTGYMLNKYLKYYTESHAVARYDAADTPEATATPEIFIPTPEPSEVPEATATPEIFIPTPEPTETPEPTATPEIFIPTPEPTVSPTPDWEWAFVLAEPDEAGAAGDEPVAAAQEDAVGEVALELGDGETHAAGFAVALSEGAALYALPEDGARVIAELPAGAALPVLQVKGGWIAVNYRQAAAYLRAEDARLADEAPEAESAGEPAGEPVLEMGTEAEAPVMEAGEGAEGTGLELVPEEG